MHLHRPRALAFAFSILSSALAASAATSIYVNQVAYDARGPKLAVIETDAPLAGATAFTVVDSATSAPVFTGALSKAATVNDWAPGKYFYQADFSGLQKPGAYKVSGAQAVSAVFRVDDQALAKLTIPSIVHFYNKQRATSPQEWAADSAVRLNDGSKRVNMRGGWADASGDVSKYFSHLAYANFMSPQQTPMVTWELTNAYERLPAGLITAAAKDSLQAEALWGADYLCRSLSPDNYFYMVVFSFFSSNANDRKVVGLLANSVTNNRWQCAFRSGGGMAIAALARISRWKKDGAYFTSKQYLDGAERAFAHLLVNNKAYDDDGKENVIDDYCALMAATELWLATDSALYRDEARKRAGNLSARMTAGGWFRANDADRPFWHAVDAGLPVVALARYLDKESDPAYRATALGTIKRALDYEIAVTHRVDNPFGYARQSFLYKGALKEGFFIPQDNETGWWWQGENARLASLAAAALIGGRLVYPAANGFGVKDSLAAFASQQMAWILGCNPYSMCFMNGFGAANPPKITAEFGHGTGKGGISNGITGRMGNGDGTGIDYRVKANGDEWRWIEQWIPHAGWFLTAAVAMAEPQVTLELRHGSAKPRAAPAALGFADHRLQVKLSDTLAADMLVTLYTPAGRKAGEWKMAKGSASGAFATPGLAPGNYSASLQNLGTYSISIP